jgi:hypothetical protein
MLMQKKTAKLEARGQDVKKLLQLYTADRKRKEQLQSMK